MIMILDSKVVFPAKQGTSKSGVPYATLLVKQFISGSNNEYSLTFWTETDIPRVMSLRPGDRIACICEAEQQAVRVDKKTGKPYPYIKGRVPAGQIRVLFQPLMSPEILNFETQDAARRAAEYAARAAATQQTTVAPAAVASATVQATPVAQTVPVAQATAVQTVPVAQATAVQAAAPAAPVQAAQATPVMSMQAAPAAQAPTVQAAVPVMAVAQPAYGAAVVAAPPMVQEDEEDYEVPF